jgi:anaerobic magnesium-protoporphyrin IX monomethyl ester cyclase
MAKLLLCHPLFLALSPAEQASSSPYFPLGLLYLAAYVRDQGHTVAIFDGTFEQDESAFARSLEQHKPDIVGISMLMPTRDMALRLAQMAKDAGTFVILGGPEVTRDPCAYAMLPQVDAVVHHEGERTLAALLDLHDSGRLTLSALHDELGIAFRDEQGQCIRNQPRAYIENLDELPMPARDLIDMERYLDTWRETNGYSSLTISTARGCPYGCDWCRDAVHGAEFRQRSPESVAAEMKLLKESYQIDRLRIVDDVDGISREWLEEWAQAAEACGAAMPFEALNDLKRKDIPLLDVRDSL